VVAVNVTGTPPVDRLTVKFKADVPLFPSTLVAGVTVKVKAGTEPPLGVTLFDGEDSRLLPTAFVARTVQVTATPFGTVTEMEGVVPVLMKGPPVPEQVAV
jgi:hypothetical protein